MESADRPTPSPPEAAVSAGRGVVALAPPPPAELKTRGLLGRTSLGAGRGIVRLEARPEAGEDRRSIVTRRHEWTRRRRRKRVLTVLAFALALFPPMWAVYLIGWLVWRNRPAQQSMRRVRQAVKSLEKDQTGMALKRLQEAHLLDPANSDALYWLGLLLAQQRRHDEANEALALVAARVPGLPEVEAALVDGYVAAGANEQAIYHAQRLFNIDPHAPEGLLKLAEAFEAAGRLDLAVEALQQAPLEARNLSEPLKQIHYRLGALYEQLGEPERARLHFKRIYARDIAFRDVPARLQALEGGEKR